MIGRIVESKAGRDAGKLFVVVELVDEQYVLIADGKYHKLDHPKKKKYKHLSIKPFQLDETYGKIKGIKFLQDSELRKVIRNYLESSKEGS